MAQKGYSVKNDPNRYLGRDKNGRKSWLSRKVDSIVHGQTSHNEAHADIKNEIRPAKNTRKRASKALVLGSTAALAVSMTGCSPMPGNNARYNQAICVDAQTDTRLPDRECDDRGTYNNGVGPLWWYMMMNNQQNRANNYVAPSVGSRIDNVDSYTKTAPEGKLVQRVSDDGKTVTSEGVTGKDGKLDTDTNKVKEAKKTEKAQQKEAKKAQKQAEKSSKDSGKTGKSGKSGRGGMGGHSGTSSS